MTLCPTCHRRLSERVGPILKRRHADPNDGNEEPAYSHCSDAAHDVADLADYLRECLDGLVRHRRKHEKNGTAYQDCATCGVHWTAAVNALKFTDPNHKATS